MKTVNLIQLLSGTRPHQRPGNIVREDDSGFTAEIIDRPIEFRRRRQAYGQDRDQTLFESAAWTQGYLDKTL